MLAQIDVTLAGLEGTSPVTCSRNVVLLPDVSLEEAAKKVRGISLRMPDLAHLLPYPNISASDLGVPHARRWWI